MEDSTMFVPKWVLIAAFLLVAALAVWTWMLASNRNPLPFPDHGSRIFSAASPDAKDAIVSLLAQHGIKERFRADSPEVKRSIMWDGTIINSPTETTLRKLGGASSSIGLVSSDPAESATRAVESLRARGFSADVVLDVEPDLPIAFVVTDAMPGTVLNFRKHLVHFPKPQPVPRG
jgi:hypothetical protein